MDDGHSWMSLMIFIVFILLDAVCYSFGAAIQNVNSNALEHDMEEGSRKAARVLKIVNRPGRFVNTIQIMTNLIGFITGAYVLMSYRGYMDILLLNAGMPSGIFLSAVSAVIITLVLMVILVSFGIVIPKRLAEKAPEKWAMSMVGIVSAMIIVFMPAIWIIYGISYVVLKLFGIDINKTGENVTEEDIMSMVNEGHEQGVLETREAEMITNIFELDDKEAGDIMTHRKNMVAIDGDTILSDAIDFILREGSNSRYPVYEKDVDNILGILHMKDALIFDDRGDYENQAISQIPGLLREAHFIPETRNIDSLFKEMQSQKIHMAIVIDEYGQTAGLVTMEDILEEIVGNIMDEYDEEEEFITACEDGSYVVNGMAPLDEVGKVIEIEFNEEEYDTYDTLNGFLISKMDRIPQDDDEGFEIECHGFIFKILKVNNKMIQTVKITAAVSDEADKEDEPSENNE